MMYFVIFFFSDFKNYFVITTICYEVMFGTMILAASLDQWHAECCETAVAENTSVYLEKKTHFSRFAKNPFFLKCQTTDILGKHA